MDSSPDFITIFDGYFRAALGSVFGLYASVAAVVFVVFTVAYTFYIVLYGYAILTNRVQADFSAFFWHAIRAWFIISLGIGIGGSTGYIAPLLQYVADILSNILGGGAFITSLSGISTSVNTLVSTLWANVLSSINATPTAATATANTGFASTILSNVSATLSFFSNSIGTIVLFVLSLIVVLLTMIIVDVFLFLFIVDACLAYYMPLLGFAFICAVSPIFISCLCWEKTTSYFERWLASALSQAFHMAFACGVLAFAANIINAFTLYISSALIGISTAQNLLYNLPVFLMLIASLACSLYLNGKFIGSLGQLSSGLVGGSSLASSWSPISAISTAISMKAHLAQLTRGKGGKDNGGSMQKDT